MPGRKTQRYIRRIRDPPGWSVRIPDPGKRRVLVSRWFSDKKYRTQTRALRAAQEYRDSHPAVPPVPLGYRRQAYYCAGISRSHYIDKIGRERVGWIAMWMLNGVQKHKTFWVCRGRTEAQARRLARNYRTAMLSLLS